MSKKSKLAYVGLGSLITIIVLILIGWYALIVYDTNPYYEVITDGMTPTISKGEIVKADKEFPFNSINKDDIILFFINDYEDVIVQRAVEILYEEPRKIRTQGDSVTKSYILDSSVYEEHYIGKIIKIYPDIESAKSDVNGRIP